MSQMMGDAASLIGRAQVVGITLAYVVGQFGDLSYGLALLFGADRYLIYLLGQSPGALLDLVEQVAHSLRALGAALGQLAKVRPATWRPGCAAAPSGCC